MDNAINIYMSILRDKKSTREQFRSASYNVSLLLAREALNQMKTKFFEFSTPVATTQGVKCADPVVLVPILRSGITMIPPFLKLFPDATVGVVGFRRDEKTAQAQFYYANFPPMGKDHQIIIVDPMIATGGTGIGTLELLKEKGISEKQILFVSIVSSQEGIDAISKQYPNINIITAACDKELNKDKFIVPGLGDFGDRYFGTLD